LCTPPTRFIRSCAIRWKRLKNQGHTFCCGITRWGTTTTAISKELTIASRFSRAGPLQDAGAADTAYVGRFEKDPGIVFVRYGHEWIAACTNDGWILEYASKNWPR
jgi:hypothetical protein